MRGAGYAGRVAAAMTLVAGLLGGFAHPTSASEGTVTDARGKPLAHAVVYAIASAPPSPRSAPPPRTAAMEQRDQEFVPHVLPVQVGTAVTFPNRDSIKHHVYSFSSAKRFELPLYSGVPAKPVTFEHPGPVVLGCNIHDWMVAYVYAVDTPHFVVTREDGRWALAGLPDGEYELHVWHPRMTGSPNDLKRRITIRNGAAERPESFALTLGRDYRRPRPLRPRYENLN